MRIQRTDHSNRSSRRGRRASRRPAHALVKWQFRARQRLRHLSWYTRLWITLFSIFTAMTLLPSLAAVISHHGFAFASTNPDWLRTKDAKQAVTVYDPRTDTTQTMPLNDYILDVLAAETDPSAPMPALQATAVAVRTYADHAMHSRHPDSTHGADLTTDGRADLPLRTDTQQRDVFGMAYAADRARLQEAITSTDGQVLTVHGQPILAFITRATTGKTRDGARELPSHPSCLPSIVCPADQGDTAFDQELHISRAKLASLLNMPEKNLNLASFKPVGVDSAGYAQSVAMGKDKWTARSFAAALGLPSTALSFDVAGEELVIRTKGSGPGYGLSIHQAQAWAASGMDWRTIVDRFYQGATLSGM